MCRVSSARGSGAAAEAGPARVPLARVLVVLLLLLSCWPARPARARVGTWPPLEPDGLTEAPLAVLIQDPAAACAWSGREGDPRLPVIVQVPPPALAEPDFLRPVLSCAERQRLEVVVRLIPPGIPPGESATEALAPWLADVESFARSTLEDLHALEISPGRDDLLEPDAWAFVVERVSSLARSFRVRCLVVAGPLPAGNDAWIDSVPMKRIRPYIDGLSVQDGGAPDGVQIMISRVDPSLPVWAHLKSGEGLADLVGRIDGAQRAGARLVSFPPPSTQARAIVLSSLLLRLPARYVPDPDPPALTVEGPEARQPIGRWTDTLGPERAVLLPAPAERGTLRVLPGVESIRSLKAFDLSTGRELAGQVEEADSGAAVDLFNVEGPVLIRYVAGKGRRAEPETVGVIASVELTAPEIIARLRAVEEGQRRATRHYTARATLSYHYQAEALNESIDVTSVNRFYWSGGVGEYEELELYINGARWRGEAPSLPFIQPEKVKDLPVEVRLDPSYDYRLAGRGKIDGRSVYILDFDPIRSGGSLYSGRVWIDAAAFTRRRIRLVQHGLTAPITDSEDIIDFGPPPGAPDGHWVPLRGYRQMVFTVLGRSVVVERRVAYGDFVMNGPRFEESREQAYASSNRISRDDDDGFAYMVRQPGGVRIRQDASMRNVAFFGGISVGSPVVSSPVAGVNYFDFDYRGTGTQVDIAWAGPFVNAAWTDPSLGGSRWELSAEGRLVGVREKLKRTTDDGRKRAEDLEVLEERIWATLARPITTHSKGEIQVGLTYQEFDPSEATGDRMVIPADLLTTTALARWRYNRAGARLELWGSASWRDGWEDWGLLARPAQDPNAPPQRAGAMGGAGDLSYSRWGASVTKALYPGALQKVGLSLSFNSGNGLDRFSRFRIGDFRNVRVRGFNGADLTFDRGVTASISWLGTIPRSGLSLEVNLDGAVIENEEDFAEDPGERGVRNPSFREYLIGGGVGVSFNGPWGTLVNVSAGTWIDSSISMSGRDPGLRILMVKTFGDWPWKKNPVERDPRSARLEKPVAGNP